MGFSKEIIGWYHQNKRDLPWRKTTDPYQIWLSEIILQQTRVDQGLAYFNKFIENYPTVDLLANASEKEVLNHWQGLGYYSRARNLHFTAKLIVNEYKGVFPTEYKDVLSLKGVGEYTAAAITSFAYGLNYPVIDGNVYRVLSRVFGVETPIDSTLGKKEFKELANELIDSKNPADYNQAIMEFGALQCKPKLPKCEDCPLRLSCFALENDLIAELPKKEKKIKQRNRFFNYVVVIDEDNIYLKERTDKDIWIGLYDFPLIESTKKIDSFKTIKDSYNDSDLSLSEKSIEFKHILSHQKIYATFWLVNAKNSNYFDANFTKIPLKEINNYPVPKLIDNYLQSIL
ncbi:MAG: A/G-specific adenine glycosylase [Vicingaceae bacterium]|nr:A/G-specific adenine glycosylase [Vicingaceae bacterium]